MKFKNSYPHYAKLYNRSVRTIVSWAKEGLNLDDETTVQAFIATKEARRGGKRQQLAEIDLPSLSQETIDSIKTGAAEALRALEQQEGRLRAELEASQSSGDQRAITLCLERWLKVNSQLRAFDLAVEASRRDSGEMISRAEAENAILNVSIWLRMASIRCNQEAYAGNRDAERSVESNIRRWVGECIKYSLDSVSPIPGWAAKTIIRGMQIDISEPETKPIQYGPDGNGGQYSYDSNTGKFFNADGSEFTGTGASKSDYEPGGKYAQGEPQS